MLKRKPVKYGQCWVFSGTLTTVCRALGIALFIIIYANSFCNIGMLFTLSFVGIPARSVTNFASAHDVPAPYYNRYIVFFKLPLCLILMFCRSVDHYFKPDGVTVDDDKTMYVSFQVKNGKCTRILINDHINRSDSVWNFHVWNDVWLARRDLKAQQYTGWQAIGIITSLW